MGTAALGTDWCMTEQFSERDIVYESALQLWAAAQTDSTLTKSRRMGGGTRWSRFEMSTSLSTPISTSTPSARGFEISMDTASSSGPTPATFR